MRSSHKNPEIAKRFMHEALTWVKLDAHPNLVQARMVQSIQGRPFLFLEYVSGGDLSKLIGIRRLTEDLLEVLRFALQFCDGISYAFSKGLKVHRDIKPQNCLITHENILKITDFGLNRNI